MHPSSWPIWCYNNELRLPANKGHFCVVGQIFLSLSLNRWHCGQVIPCLVGIQHQTNEFLIMHFWSTLNISAISMEISLATLLYIYKSPGPVCRNVISSPSVKLRSRACWRVCGASSEHNMNSDLSMAALIITDVASETKMIFLLHYIIITLLQASKLQVQHGIQQGSHRKKAIAKTCIQLQRLKKKWYQVMLLYHCNSSSHVTTLSTTRTTRMPAFWDTPHRPMITHTIGSHQIPSQNKTKSKLQILKNCQKFKFCKKLYK